MTPISTTSNTSNAKDPFELTLAPKLAAKIVAAQIARVDNVVMSCQDRDSDLRMLRDQLEAVSNPITNDPWPGAAIIESSLSREFHTTLLSTCFAAAKQSPYVGLKAVVDGEQDAADKFGVYLNTKAEEFGYEKTVYDKIYIALESRFAPTCFEAYQPVKRYFKLQAKTDMGVVDPALVGDDEESVDQVVLVEEPQPIEIRSRSVAPWDYYHYPLTAWDPQYEAEGGAIAILHRMFLSEEDLLLGVLELGYDAEAVNEMLKQGPTMLQGEAGIGREDEYNRDGVSMVGGNTERSSGMWECFKITGRAPYLPDENGKPSIPDALLHTDSVFLVCPQRNVCLKMAYSSTPEGLRPYTVTHAYEKPQMLEGEGIVSLLTQQHDEDTATQRFYINNMNLEACPAMSVPETYLTKYAKWKMAPGRFLPRLPGDDIGPKPIVWDIGSQQLITPMLDRLYAASARIAASEGVNAGMTGQPLKAEQVRFSDAMQQLKFDLVLANIQRGIAKDFEIMAKMLVQHMDDEENIVSGGATVTLQKDEVDGKSFKFIPQANSQNASPTMRQQKMQNIAAIVQQWWTWQAQMMQAAPENLNAAWKLSFRLLMVAGEPAPEQYLGPEPPTPEQLQQMQEEMMMQQQQMMQAPMGLDGQPPPQGQSGQPGQGMPPININNNVLNGALNGLNGSGA